MNGLLSTGAADYSAPTPPFYTPVTRSSVSPLGNPSFTLRRGVAVTQVSINSYTMCVLFSDSRVSCFGRSPRGAHGADTNLFIPVVGVGPGEYLVFSSTDQAVLVETGWQHSCAVFSNGRLRCWGANGQGQCGNGPPNSFAWGTGMTLSQTPFVDFSTTHVVTAVAAGAQNTCALFSNSRMRCFGNGVNGLTGLGTTSNWGSTVASSTSLLPFLTFVSLGDPPVLKLSIGQWHACMVFSGGGVACFGYNEDGALGTDSTEIWGSTAASSTSNLPFIQFSSTHPATDVVALYLSSCALFNNKMVRCWGRNKEGESGQDSTTNWGSGQPGSNPISTLPFVKLPSGLACDEISGTSYHICCKTPDLRAFCWGTSYYGLDPNGCYAAGSATGGAPNLMSCVKPFVPLKPVYRFEVILSGTSIFSSPEPYLFIRIRSSSVSEPLAASVKTIRPAASYSFLANGRPLLAPLNLDLSGAKVAPVLLEYAMDGVDDAGLFVFVCPNGALNEIGGIYAGGDSTCILIAPTPGGLAGVKCFGANTYAQLGQGHSNNLGDSAASAVSDIPFINFGDRNVVDRGQLSTGAAVGGDHVCFLFNWSHERQNAVCLGRNDDGQAGYNSAPTLANDTPSLRSNLAQNSHTELITQIQASDTHTCALYGTQNLVRCWGANQMGQLGTDSTVSRGADSDTTFSAMPYIALPENSYIADLAAGFDHTCILYRTGRIRCWGGGSQGQLGADSTVSFGSGVGALALSSAPLVSFSTTHPAVKISAGKFFTCAVFVGGPGAIRCWGDGALGRTGRNSAALTCNSPASSCTTLAFLSFHPGVLGTYEVVAISSYRSHSCAIFKLPATSLGLQRVLCWGDGANGKLGRDNSINAGSGGAADSLTHVNFIPFPTGDSAIQVATGIHHSCALFVFGGAKCWGLGASGQLGTDSTDTQGGSPTSSITSLPFIASGGVGLSVGQASRIFVGPNPLRLDAPFSHRQGGALNFSHRPYKLSFTLLDGASGTISSTKMGPSDDADAKITVSMLHSSVSLNASVVGFYYGATPTVTYYRGGVVYSSGPLLSFSLAAGQNSERFVAMVQAGANCNGASAYSLELRRDPRPQIISLQVFVNTSGVTSLAALSPAFSPLITTYTVSVSDRATAVMARFFHNPNNTASTGTVNGAVLASGTVSLPYPRVSATPALDVVAYSLAGGPGSDPLTNYSVTLNILSSNCSLSLLNLSIGALAPPFSPAVRAYKVTYPSAWPLTATLVQATPALPASTTVAAPAGPVPESGSPVSVTATAADGTTCTYTASMYRQLNVSALVNLSDSLGASTGLFAPATTVYSLAVPFAATSVNVTAVGPAVAYTSMAWPLGPLASGVTSPNAPLAVGVNSIGITVTAEDPAVATVYTLLITRRSNVSDLVSFVLHDALAGPLAFNATFLAANATTAFAAAVTRTSNATVAVLLAGFTCASAGLCTVRVNNQAPGAPLTLTPGANRLTVVSTAQDALYQSAYTVDLTLVLVLPPPSTPPPAAASLAPLPSASAAPAPPPGPGPMPPVAPAPVPAPGPILVSSTPALLPLAGGNLTVVALNLNLSALVSMVLLPPTGVERAAAKRLGLQVANATAPPAATALSPEGVVVLVAGSSGNASMSQFTVSLPAVPAASYGSLNVTSLQTLQRASWGRVIFFTDDCPEPGSYGLGAACRPCPEGGVCPGGNRVWPKSGYWNPDESSGYVIECNPAARCLGGPASACAPGYKGRLCSECEVGWEPLQGLCVKCPPTNTRLMVTVLGDICVWTIVVLSSWFASDDETYNKVVEVVTVFRSIGQFGALLQSTMPTTILYVFNVLRIFMGDIEIVQDRCRGKVPSFLAIYMFNVLYCFLVGVGAPVGVLALSAFKSEFMAKYKANADLKEEMKRRHADRVVRSCQHWAVLVYYILLRNSLQALYCVKVGKSHVLATRPMYKCFDLPHIVTFIVSLLILPAFTIGYPVLYGRWMAARTARERRRLRRRMGVGYETLKPERWWLFVLPFFESIALSLVEVFASGSPKLSTGLALAIVSAQIAVMLTFPFLKKRDSGAALLYLVPMFLLIPASYLSSVHTRHEATVKIVSWTAIALFILCIAFHLSDLVFRSVLSKGGRYGEYELEASEAVTMEDRASTFEEVEERARRVGSSKSSSEPAGGAGAGASTVGAGDAKDAIVGAEGDGSSAQENAGVFSGVLSTLGIAQAYDFFASLFAGSEPAAAVAMPPDALPGAANPAPASDTPAAKNG